MTEAKLAILQKKLLHPKDWDLSLGYFFEEFANKKEMVDMSVKAHIPIIESIIGQLCRDVFHHTTVSVLNNLMVYKAKPLGMIHGHCEVERNTIVFFYLTKIHKGIFGITTPAGHLKHSTRISALPPEELDMEREVYGDQWEPTPN